ncbi:MAG TPA: GTPase HflX [Verrucomicrobiae bacterium]|jgi:GTP-binding protein HflX|nr:GTPase HflX [Verrucomicrobiae bacterium]
MMKATRRDGPERAFLVAVEFRHRSRSQSDIELPRQAVIARNSVSEPRGTEDSASESGSERASRARLDDLEESLAEYRELATSAGAEIVGEFVQRRDRPDPATLIGKGKLHEIAAAAASAHADLILVDHELSPSQQRNLEAEVDARVIDRTQLILDIFARHARSREGQLQVELAQLEYLLPRLTGRGVEMSQLGGGIGTRGPGETQLETDRRKIHRRIRHIKDQVEEVRRVRAHQRQRRESVPLPTIALVGYTNAGKSTLFNALTHAGVLISERMFATLDPTIRAITLPSKRKVLLSDTVGFIRGLPTTLVTAFRATLEEVQRASLLLHVSDVTSPVAREQQQQVDRVLKDLEVKDIPQIRVMNKLDLLPEAQQRSLVNSASTVYISAARSAGMDGLLAAIDARLEIDAAQRLRIRVPQAEGKVLAEIEARARVLKRSYRDSSVQMDVEAPESLARTLRQFEVKPRAVRKTRRKKRTSAS